MINEYCTFAFVANIHTTSFDRFNSTVRLILLNQILSISKHYGEFTILPYQNIEKNFLRRPPPPGNFQRRSSKTRCAIGILLCPQL